MTTTTPETTTPETMSKTIAVSIDAKWKATERFPACSAPIASQEFIRPGAVVESNETSEKIHGWIVDRLSEYHLGREITFTIAIKEVE